MRLSRHQALSPIATICALYHREKWNELGGVDKRFKTVFWDIDMSLRFYEAGGAPFLAPDCPLAIDNTVPGKLTKTGRAGRDRRLLDKFWKRDVVIDGKKTVEFFQKRLSRVRRIEF